MAGAWEEILQGLMCCNKYHSELVRTWNVLTSSANMIGAGDGVGDSSRARARCAWRKFTQLVSILTSREASLKVKGKVYNACVQIVLE